jgi:hypothetical protein
MGVRKGSAIHHVSLLVSGALALILSGCGTGTTTVSSSEGTPIALPHFDHIVVVIEENHSYDDINGSTEAPYIQALAQHGAVFTDSHGVAHPSQPNYLALFSGATFGLTSDACPQAFKGPDLAGELIAASKSFSGYSEDLPQEGFTGCFANGNNYARKHNPWVNFTDVPASSNEPFSAFPTDFIHLPSVAFVVPNQQHDMHSGSIGMADSWLKTHIDPYAQWAANHNSLLIVTWDEDDSSTTANHILTLFVGAHLNAGHYAETIAHIDVLRTIEAIEGISFTQQAVSATTIADVWRG